MLFQFLKTPHGTAPTTPDNSRRLTLISFTLKKSSAVADDGRAQCLKRPPATGDRATLRVDLRLVPTDLSATRSIAQVLFMQILTEFPYQRR
jgi:hypothetical protein